ncbi:MAG: 30S ribosomal protein S15 [Patescibacteria group bacterium]
MLSKETKQRIIKRFQTHEGDTGSAEIQIAILTYEIKELVEHLKIHHKDHSSRRGLLRKISERRTLLKYLKKENPSSYEELVKRLHLKQARELERPGVQNAVAGTKAELEDVKEEVIET